MHTHMHACTYNAHTDSNDSASNDSTTHVRLPLTTRIRITRPQSQTEREDALIQCLLLLGNTPPTAKTFIAGITTIGGALNLLANGLFKNAGEELPL